MIRSSLRKPAQAASQMSCQISHSRELLAALPITKTNRALIAKLQTLFLVAVISLLCSSVQAQWLLLDDFENATADAVVSGTNSATVTWDGDALHQSVVDSGDAGNQVLQILGENTAQRLRANFTDPQNNIATGSVGTVFFRFRTADVTTGGASGAVVGLTPSATESDYNFKCGLRLVTNSGSNQLEVRNGGGYDAIDSLASNTWYSLWIVADNTSTTAGTFKLYLQSDTDPNYATQTQLETNSSADDIFDFRINGATDIVNVYFRTSNDGSLGNELYYDDIYLNHSAEDLTDPRGPYVLLGDVNLDGAVDFADIPPFITRLITGVYQAEADIDQSGVVDFQDIPAFIAILLGGGNTGGGTDPVSGTIELDQYGMSGSLIQVGGVVTDDLSGVTYSTQSNTLFTVLNGEATIVELELDGTIKSVIDLQGFDDTEGIVHLGGSRFGIVEEGRRNFVTISLDDAVTSGSTTTLNRSAGIVIPLGSPSGSSSVTNSGIEGVAYDPATDTVYAVWEKDAPTIRSFDLTAAEASPGVTPTMSTPLNASGLSNMSDLAGLHFVESTNTLLILSQESRRIIEVDPSGNVQDGDLALNGMNEPEGVTVGPDGTIYVVGESDELAIFVPGGTGGGDPGGDTGNTGEGNTGSVDVTGATYTATPDSLEDVLAGAVGGDEIIVTGSGEISLSNYSFDAPVLIRAATVGGTTLANATVSNSNNIALQGFIFGPNDESTLLKVENSTNIKILRNLFDHQDVLENQTSIVLTQASQHVEIGYNTFREKNLSVNGGSKITGSFIKTQFDGGQLIVKNLHVHHNHFNNIAPYLVGGVPAGDSDREAIAMGIADSQDVVTDNLVEYNLFENCDGENEIITVKTSDNVFRYNTFKNSMGSLSFRLGSNNEAYGNYFYGTGPHDSVNDENYQTGGIRIYGSGHQIYDNFMKDLSGESWRRPILVDSGDTSDSTGNDSHETSTNAFVSDNTIVNCVGGGIHVGGDNYSNMPTDITITDNTVVSTMGALFNNVANRSSNTWSGNKAYATGAADAVGGASLSSSEVEVLSVAPSISEPTPLTSSDVGRTAP